MKISNRIKRNISFSILMLGVALIVARAWEVVMTPSSGKAWFHLCGAILLSYLCFDSFRQYHKRVKQGIAYGSKVNTIEQSQI